VLETSRPIAQVQVRVPVELIERIVEVLHPEEIRLFGSRARGEARSDSDWDFMAILPDDAPEQDLDIGAVWRRLRDLRLQRVEVFTMTRGDFEEWRHSLGTLAQIVASTGIVVQRGAPVDREDPRLNAKARAFLA
jgi:predicted nucleotidyltransferase